MDNTANFGFGMPLGGENYDVEVQNDNWTAADTVLKNQLDRIVDIETDLAYTPWASVVGEVSVRTATGGAAAPTTAITTARAMKLGKTVTFCGVATVGATAVVDAAIMLPASLGVPFWRVLEFGTLLVTKTDGGAPADQTGTARMTADKTRIVVHSDTSGFRDAPAGSNISWFVQYEVA